ncbi:MAG: glycosyltransferase family 2 protein [Planctomycetota bacterium]|nr:MAG: glycosyltransferase family 2 protein [Planctomycetota bacterium]
MDGFQETRIRFMDIELSVVMPCLNEEGTIADCIAKALNAFEQMGISGEVVVVDNGSTDSSVEIAKNAGARIVIESVRGYGQALKRGFEEAYGKYIIMGDADSTYDFSEIKEFVRLLREGADLVMGSRLKGNIYPKAMPWLHRWVGTPALTKVINLFFNVRISDVNCGLRGFKKESIRKLDLKCRGMEFASEMVAKAGQKKLNIKEIPISYHATPPGRTPSLRTFADGWRHLRFMLMFSPRYLFLLPGLIIFLFGLLFTTVLFLKESIVIFNIPLGVSTAIFANACLLTGLQVMLFGVYAIILNSSQGLIERDRISDFFEKNFTLERGLVIGAVILGVGIIMGITTIVLIFKLTGDFSEIHVSLTKLAAVSIFIVLLGIQMIFSSFYISLFSTTKTLK